MNEAYSTPQGNATKDSEMNIARNILHKEVESLAEEANALVVRLQSVLAPMAGDGGKPAYSDVKSVQQSHSETVTHLIAVTERIRMTRATLRSLIERLEV